jgi:hypothetical protein
MKNIKVIINEDGKIKIEYSGFQGDECFLEAKKLYEKLKNLGVNVEIQATQVTQEFYSKVRSSVRS